MCGGRALPPGALGIGAPTWGIPHAGPCAHRGGGARPSIGSRRVAASQRLVRLLGSGRRAWRAARGAPTEGRPAGGGGDAVRMMSQARWARGYGSG